jgi:AcrR family transcriptional regulator
MHTRERIVESAADLFAVKGFHGTSVDDVARAVGGSRSLVYQYFPDKNAIFVELAHECDTVATAHAAELSGVGPDPAGISRLRAWLHEWERLYDRYASVFLEFPGIGPVSGHPQADAGVLSERYTRAIADRLDVAQLDGLSSEDAAVAMLRIAHMTNLYRYRKMFDLPAGEAFSDSLTVVIQRLLFPDTPGPAIDAAIPAHVHAIPEYADVPASPPADTTPALTKREILASSATLFTAHGYYAVGMPDIRDASGISRATLYRYFSTKMEILAELSTAAVWEGAQLAGQLSDISHGEPDLAEVREWMCRYLALHRRYGGVIRAWYDGTLREHLATAVGDGVAPFRRAASDLLCRVGVPARIDPAVAAAAFLAVLGRTGDLIVTLDGATADIDAADFMLTILRRSVLAEWRV